MKRISVLVIAALTLAGCAARRAVVLPQASIVTPQMHFSWCEQHEAQSSCLDWTFCAKDAEEQSGYYSATAVELIGSHYDECKKLLASLQYAERLKDAAWTVVDACTHDCETAGREFAARKQEWMNLEDKYRGIVRYSCPAGWALLGQTCWSFRPITEPDEAMTLKDGAVCHFTLTDSGQCLCEKPASK